ncbi:MAG: hypothetical protein ACREA0_13895 [bacterium]
MSKKTESGVKPAAPPAPTNAYAGKFGVNMVHHAIPAFVIVRLGNDVGDGFMTEYQPLLALDPKSGEVLMHYDWDEIDDDAENWRPGAVFVPRGLLSVFDDFETAYFYAQGLTRRAA